MTRVLSGVQPSGRDPHLGNYLGAFARWADEQQPDQFFCVVDLHAMTVEYDASQLADRTRGMVTSLLACGLDPQVVTIFVQSHVREHTELAWIMSCVATVGELNRMTQFKDKGQGRMSVSAGLFTYPVLMAADILAYDAQEVPVGDDQRQHVELARDLAQRFNSRFGDVLTVPKATFPQAGARVMDLQQVHRKMSKSIESPQGTIGLLESPEQTRRKIMRAVTDSGSEVRAAPDKPGITNLLDLLSGVTGRGIGDLERDFADARYGDFKSAVADAVNERLAPVRQRYAELSEAPDEVDDVIADGARRAREVAGTTMARVREAAGLLPG